MKTVVFMLEEPSMEMVLLGILPRLLPATVHPICIRHQGKRDLELSLTRKLRSWSDRKATFVILGDQHSEDCLRMKRRLKTICRKAGRPDAIIRIVCPELEAWLLGDLVAVAKAFGLPRIAALKGKRKYSAPDRLANAAQELRSILPDYQKISGARAVAPLLDLENNRSQSFQLFVRTVRSIASAAFPLV